MNMQTDLFAAVERGKAGMERAVDKADRVVPDWSEMALRELRLFARIQEHPFTIEAARIGILVPEPSDGRAWGSVTQQAIKRGMIVKTNTYAPAASSNGSPKMLYLRGPCA